MPARPHEFSVSSRLAADRDRVWQRVTSMEGVNHELAPLLRMTHPPDLERLDAQEVALGQRLFRSWVKLFGVLPFDYDDIVLERVERGRGFLERSTMLSQRSWEHERTLEDAPGGCLVTDRVRFVSRLPIGRALRPLLRRFFVHRHRRLCRHFGGEAIDAR